jgi:hypothetical protein
MNGDDSSGSVEREMGLDHADFWRLLPRVLVSLRWERQGTRARIELAEGLIDIALGTEGVRRIALMTIPVTPVTITWRGVNAPEIEAFLARFDREYQRGGG